MKNFKRIFAILMVILTVAATMAACSNAPEEAKHDNTPKTTAAATKAETPPETEVITTAVSTEATTEKATEAPTEKATEAPTEKATEASTTAAAQAPVIENTNYFFNDANNAYDANALSIKPRYVYWDGDMLVAECFVINGFGHNVYDISVDSLGFSNQSGDIAKGAFGALDGVVIAPYSYVTWTFTFSPDAVFAAGADLSSLRCVADTYNKY